MNPFDATGPAEIERSDLTPWGKKRPRQCLTAEVMVWKTMRPHMILPGQDAIPGCCSMLRLDLLTVPDEKPDTVSTGSPDHRGTLVTLAPDATLRTVAIFRHAGESLRQLRIC